MSSVSTAAAPNKHQKRTEATKRKLLQSGRRIFVRDGFEAARIEEIAAEAGFTRGAFYAHFESKETLFFSMLEEQLSLRLQKLRATLRDCLDETARIQKVRQYYATRSIDRQWCILIMEFKLYALRHLKHRAKLAEAHRNIRSKMKLEALQGLMPGGLQHSVESREAKVLTLEVVRNGLVLERAYDPKRISDHELSEMLAWLFDLIVTAPKI